MNNLLLTITLIGSLLLTSCSQSSSQNNKNDDKKVSGSPLSSLTPSQQTTPKKQDNTNLTEPLTESSNLDTEAEKQVKDYAETNFYTQCGDSYYKASVGKVSPYIVQCANPKFSAFSRSLTEADNRNDVQWIGEVNFSYSAARTYFKDGGWTKWENGINECNSIFKPVEKRKNTSWKINGGNTEVHGSNGEGWIKYRKIDCSELPK